MLLVLPYQQVRFYQKKIDAQFFSTCSTFYDFCNNEIVLEAIYILFYSFYRKLEITIVDQYNLY